MCYLNCFVYITLVNVAVIVLGEKKAEFHNDDFLDMESTPQTTLIIDTDAGVDDGMAILNLLGAEELFKDVKVRLITTVNGNTNVDNVAMNVLKILKTAERLDIPVYKGANQSLLATPEVDDYFGKDGFGDFDFPNPPSTDLLREEHAVNALIQEATVYPGQLTLLCLGPLTNIALAARLDAKFFNKLKEIYILGGSDSGIGNIKPGVEFNFFMDPEAASVVLKEAERANKVLNVLTWETAYSRSLISMKWRKEVLGVVKSPQMELMNKAESPMLVGTHWFSSDTLLSSVILKREIVESSDVYHADVEVCGALSRGSVFIDHTHSMNSTKNIRILKKINTERLQKMLLQNLNPMGGENNGAPRN